MHPLIQAKSHAAAPQAVQFPPANARVATLNNGLTLIVQEDHSSPVASVQAWVETGSIHEGKHCGAGVSHMLEHMLFKGTEKLSCNDFARQVQDAGGYINAYTSFDRTVYWIDIPSKGAATAIALLSDAVMNSTLPPHEFEKEQEVIRREFAMGFDDPDRVCSTALFATAYREHPYKHPIIGHLDVFNAIARDDVMAYYKARYVPNNIFFSIAGDVDADAVIAQLKQLFSAHPRAALPPIYIPAEPPQLGSRTLDREFATELTRLHIAWHTPDAAHPDVPALDVVASVLGHGRSCRLYRNLREEAGVVHNVDAWCYAPGQAGLWGIDALLDPEHRERVEAEALRAIEKLQSEGTTIKELDKAKRQTLCHQIGAVTTMRGKASDLASNWLLARNLDFSRDYLAAIQKVSEDDLRRVAARWLTDANRTSVSLNPHGSMKKKSARNTTAGGGEIKKFELSNGLRLLVREDARLPLVSIAATFKAGLLAETPASNGITRLLAKVMVKGAGKRSSEALADEIEAVGGAIATDAGNNSLTAYVRVMQPDVSLGLELLSDILCAPALPDGAIAREKEAQIAAIKAEEEEVTSIARNLLRQTMFGAHPYGLRGLGTPESVAAIDRAALVAFHRRHIVGRNGVIAVFGNVNATEIHALVEKYLSDLPPGEAAFSSLPQPAVIDKQSQSEEYRDKAQAVLIIGYPGSDLFSADRAALDLIDEASSDIGSRFFVRIREEMGLAYFVGSSNMAGLAPGSFAFYLGTDPIKLIAVQAELSAEIHDLAKNGLSAAELSRAKEKLIGQQDIRNQSNDAFAMTSALDELYGLGFDHYKRQRAQVEAVTLEEIKRVANSYFLNQPATIAIVRPRTEAHS